MSVYRLVASQAARSSQADVAGNSKAGTVIGSFEHTQHRFRDVLRSPEAVIFFRCRRSCVRPEATGF
jgi:hypothetical protein